MFGFLAPFGIKLVGRLLGHRSSKVLDVVEGALDKWHEDGDESARVKATLRAHEAEVAGQVATAVYASRAQERSAQAASSKWWISGASVVAEWAVGLSLVVYLLPQNIVTAIFWTHEVITGGALIPYPSETPLLHLVGAVGGFTALNLVKGALR